MTKQERTFRLVTMAAGAMLIAILAGFGASRAADTAAVVTETQCVVIDAPPIILKPLVEKYTNEMNGTTDFVLSDEEAVKASVFFQLVTGPQAFINRECSTVVLTGMFSTPEEVLRPAYEYTGFLVIEARKKEAQ